MSDSEDDEAEAAEFMSQPEINEFLEEAEEEKESSDSASNSIYFLKCTFFVSEHVKFEFSILKNL